MKIAVIGVACRLPGSISTLHDLWETLSTGRDAVTEIPPDRFGVEGFSHPLRSSPGRSCTFAAGVVDDIADFDYGFFGMSKTEAEYLDPQQRMVLEMAWEALEDAQIKPSSIAGSKTSVFVGSSSMDASIQRSDDPCIIGPYSMIGNTLSLQANRVSYFFDLHGPSMVLDTACSSSLVALHQACQTLVTGDCNMAFAGGIHALLCPLFFVGFSKAHMLSKDGRCKVFSKDANGYVRSEGGGMLLLKPLDAALADGDPIHAVIAKTGVNTDGRTVGVAVPSKEAQSALLTSLYDAPDVDPRNIAYVEAHGTGTSVGDPIEAGAIGEVFSRLRPKGSPLLVGSVKSNLGHLEPASGMAGFLKTLVVLKHKTVPPNIHLEELSPEIDFAGLHLEPVRKLTPLPSTPGLAIAGVNSFGFGGANAHVMLEEAPAGAPHPRCIPELSSPGEPPTVSQQTQKQPRTKTHAAASQPTPPLLLSAKSPASLRVLAGEYASLLAGKSDDMFATIAGRAALRRDALSHRLVVQGPSPATIIEALEQVAQDTEPTSPDVLLHTGEALGGDVRTVFVFSGNGGNWIGMGRALAEGDAAFGASLNVVDGIMSPLLGHSIQDLMCAPVPPMDVERIELAQPLLFTLQVCLADALRARGIRPDMVLGHSIGEVAAAYCSGALSLEQACLLIVVRSQLQQESRGQGGMAVAQLSEEEALELPQVRSGELELAAVNSNRYVTLTGASEALNTVKASLKKQRLVFRRLNLEHPFHSSFMEPLKERLLERLQPLRPQSGDVPFISTVAGEGVSGSSLDANYWWHNIRKPVLFEKAVQASLQAGGRLFVELGPDSLLQPFVNACFQAQSASTVYVPSLKKGKQEGDVVARLWAKIFTAGGNFSPEAVFQEPSAYTPLPSYPWDKEYCAIEPTPEGLGLLSPKPSPHPMLGHRIRRDMPVWEQTVDTHLLPFIGEHIIGGDVILPGAAYTDIALAAAIETYESDMVELENVELYQPMTFHGSKARVIRFTLSPQHGDFTIESREQLHTGGMTLHAVGRIVPKLSKTLQASTPLNTQMLHAGDYGNPLDLDDMYSKARQISLQFGPAFKTFRTLWRNGDEAIAHLKMPTHAAYHKAVLHPSLLDGAYQMLLGLADWKEQGLESFMYMPFRTGRLQLLRPGEIAYAHCEMSRQTARSQAASFTLYDEDGQELARLKDCHFIRMQTRENLQREQYVYAVTPVPARHPADAAPSPLQPLDTTADAIAPAISALQEAPRWTQRRQEIAPFLTAVAVSVVHETLCELPELRPGAHSKAAANGVTISQIIGKHGLDIEQEAFLTYALILMEDMELASRTKDVRGNDTWRLETSDLPPATELWREALKAYPAYAGTLALLGQAAELLPKCLRDATAAQPLLALAQGSQLEQLRNTSPLYLDAAAAVGLVVEQIRAGLPQGAAIRILEVDAGAGEVSQAILSQFPPGAFDYLLTDRDENFVEQLKARFEERPDVSVLHMIPEDPESPMPPAASQGVDLVVLGGPLSRMPDTPQALARLKKLLRPGGVVLVSEVLPHPQQDLLFGLAPDWWRGGAPGGAPRSRLRTVAEWKALLEHAGFSQPVSLLDDSHEADIALLAAQAPLPADVQPGLSLPLSDPLHVALLMDDAPSPAAQAVADRVEAAMAQSGNACTRIIPDASFDPESASHWAGRIAITSDGETPLHCIHLIGFDVEQDLSPDTLDTIQNSRVVSAIAIAQGWLQQRVPAALTLVTGGGVPLEGYASRPTPSQGSLPGLGRVLMNEVSGLNIRLVDVHANPGAFTSETDDATKATGGCLEWISWEALLRELLCPAPDAKEVVLVGGARFCLRLARLEVATMALPRTAPPKAIELDIAKHGRLSGACWRETIPPTPEPGTVLVQNQATGVNYRDIMFTLGRIPEEALEAGASGPTLGLESAGTVLAVGEGVTTIAPGDAVCCMGGSLYDSHVLVREGTAYPIPEGLDPSAAASIPVAHFTAWYALTHLARLQPGEKVLIHGAAGGVGLAAIQIAMWCGAEIYATAGSDAKRSLLSRLGVQHIFNSRSLDFEDTIRQATGGRGIDVVLNSISGEALFKSMELLRPLGRFLELGKVDFYSNTPLRMRLLRNNISFYGIDVDQVMAEQPALCRKLFMEMLERFEAGDLWPIPHAIYPHAAIPEAFRCMQQSKHIGKIVVEHHAPKAEVHGMKPETLGPLSPNASYLVTGGLGGLGLVTARRLVELGARHLILLSRSGAKTEAQQAAVAAWQAQGVEVALPKLDLADSEALREVLQSLQKTMPPVRGVVHCAGVLRDAAIMNLTPEDVRTVMRAKALGGWNLHLATLESPLDFFVMYSSSTTVLGNPGQGNYVAANTMLECLVSYRRSLGLPAVAFGWGTVSDVGMLAERPELLESLKQLLGAQELRAEVALDFVEQLTHHPLNTMHVFRMQLKKLSRLPYVASAMYQYVLGEGTGDQSDHEQVDIRAALQDLSPKDAVLRLGEMLTQHFAKIMRVPASKVRQDKPLSELGMDSLMYVELGLATEETFGVDISSLSLDKTSSILTLADMIYRQLQHGGDAEDTSVATAALVSQHASAAHGVSLSVEETQRLLQTP